MVFTNFIGCVGKKQNKKKGKENKILFQTNMDDDDNSSTFVKEESSFLTLDPSLSEVEWKDGLFPIEVHLVGEISTDSVSELETKFREAQRSGQKEIPLVIQSEGGSMYDALKIVDLILTSSVPVTTIIRGYAMSAAVMLFSCGKTRVIGPHASLMIHNVSSTFIEGKLADIKVESKEMERLNDEMCAIMSENTGKPKNYFKKRLEKNTDVYMSPTEALKCNLATHIGDARLNTNIVVNSSIDIVEYNVAKRRRVTTNR